MREKKTPRKYLQRLRNFFVSL